MDKVEEYIRGIKDGKEACLSELREKVEGHKRRLQSIKDTTRDAMEYKVYDSSIESLKYVLNLIDNIEP